MKKSNEQTTGQSGAKMKSTYELNQLGANIVGNPKRLDMTVLLLKSITTFLPKYTNILWKMNKSNLLSFYPVDNMH